MSEASRTSAFLKQLEAHGYWTYKISDRIRSGIPDALVVRDGEVTFIEFKLGNPGQLAKLIRPAQMFTLRKLVKAGAIVRVVLFDGKLTHYYTVAGSELALMDTREGVSVDPGLL